MDVHDSPVAAFAKNAGEGSRPAFLANAATKKCRMGAMDAMGARCARGAMLSRGICKE
jgi:hypothetical protein